MKREEATLRCKTTEQAQPQLAPSKALVQSPVRPAADSRYIESRLKQFALR